MSKDLKKVLLNSLELEGQLRNFCIDCLTLLYQEKSKLALFLFNEQLDEYEHNHESLSFNLLQAEFEELKEHDEWLKLGLDKLKK